MDLTESDPLLPEPHQLPIAPDVPPKLPQGKKRIAGPLLVGVAVTIIVGIIGALFVYTRLPTQPTQTPARAKQSLEGLKPALEITLQSFYQNPFDADTTYVNPFSTYQNPFAQNEP